MVSPVDRHNYRLINRPIKVEIFILIEGGSVIKVLSVSVIEKSKISTSLYHKKKLFSNTQEQRLVPQGHV